MADGYLNFDTGVNTGGFNSGVKNIGGLLKGLKTSLGKVALAVGAAFSVKAVTEFSKESKAAWNTQLLAETKLETVMKQRMKATDGAVQSIKDFASSQQKLGVIGDEVQLAGAQQVATFLSETDSIKTLMPAMNNLLAQQKGLNATSEDAVNIGNLMGKVMQGQTSALTRVGITFSDAEEQVLKYGTESQKAAMLAKVITNNVGEMNSALAQTDSGRQAQLSNTLGDIKEQFGAAVTQIEVMFLPALQTLADKLAKVAAFAREVSQSLAEVFGVDSSQTESAAKGIADSTETAADNYENISESAEETKESQEGTVASFDQINKLEDSSSESKNAGATPSAIGSQGVVTLKTDVDTSEASKKIGELFNELKSCFSQVKKYADKNFKGIFSEIWDGLLQESSELAGTLSRIFSDIKSFSEPLKNYFAGDFTVYLKTVFSTLGKIAVGLFDTFNKVFSDIWNLAVFPIVSKFLNVGLPLITQFSTQIWNTLGVLFDSVKSIFDTLWSGVVSPILGFISQLWCDTWQLLSDFWAEWGQPIFDGINTAITTTKDIFLNIWETILKPVFDKFMETLDMIWTEHLQPLIAEFLDFVGELVTGATDIYNQFIAPIVNWLVDVLGPIVVKVVNSIQKVVGGVIGNIIDAVKGVITVLKGIVQFISGVFTGNWKKAWKGIKNIFKGIWDTFYSIVKTPVNLIIGAVNKMTGAIEDAINWIIDGINSLSFTTPDWLPGDLGGKTFGFDLDYIDIPEIPKLATGAVIPPNSEFLAVLGDQKRGTNIEAPLDTIRQALLEALVAYGGTGGNGQKISVTIPISLNGKVISQLVIDDINDYIKRNGRSPIMV